MKDFSAFIIIYIIQNCVTAEWNTKDFIKREHSLMKPYQATGMTIPHWDFLGSTIVTSNYIRLTPDQQSKKGGLWNLAPCNMVNWELQVQFKIHGNGKELFGDGLAIWYAKDRMKEGPVFGSTDYYSGLAVIIDTYSNHNGEHNHNHPYISAMINNGTLHYDHDRDGTHTQLAGCEVKLRNYDHDTYLAIRYEADTLSVYTDLDNKAAWKECFSVKGVKLPTGYYFGMSAATGDLSDNHDIIAVRTYELESTDVTEDRSKIIPEAMTFEAPRERTPDLKQKTTAVKMFVVFLLGALLLIVLSIVGIMIYQKFKKDSEKRFY